MITNFKSKSNVGVACYATQQTTDIRGYQILFRFYRAHTYFLGPLLQQPHISEQLYIRSAQFLYNINSIVQTCFMNALYNSNSVIGLKIAYFRAKYRVNFITSTRSTIMSSIRVTVPTENQTVSINNLFSLLSARSDLSFIEGFNLVEIIEMIDYVSTS